MPNGVMVPAVSPARKALKARRYVSVVPGAMHSRHAAARSARRRPANARIDHEPPADALDAVDDVCRTGSPDDPGEQRQAAERAERPASSRAGTRRPLVTRAGGFPPA